MLEIWSQQRIVDTRDENGFGLGIVCRLSELQTGYGSGPGLRHDTSLESILMAHSGPELGPISDANTCLQNYILT